MKKLLTVMMLCVSASACAEWKLIEFNDEAAFYIEDFFEQGVRPLVWELVDYKTPNKFGNLSARILWEMDCPNGLLRRVIFSTHPYRMGIGAASVMDKEPGEWEKPVSDSPQETIFILACGITPGLGPKI